MMARLLSLLFLAAAPALPFSLADNLEIQSEKKTLRGLYFHDLVILDAGASFGDHHGRFRLNLLGIGGGHYLADVYSSMPLFGMASFRGGDGGPALLGITSSLAGITSAFLMDHVSSRTGQYLLLPMVLFPYVLNPEIRLLPLLPVHAYAGYSFDLLPDDGLEPIQAIRAGLSARYKHLRVKTGLDETFYRGARYRSYSVTLGFYMGDFDGAMSI